MNHGDRVILKRPMRIDRLHYTIAPGFAYFDAPGVLGEMSAAQSDLIPVVGEAIELWGVKNPCGVIVEAAQFKTIAESRAKFFNCTVVQLIAFERKA